MAELFLVLFLVTHVLSVTLSLSTAPGRHATWQRFSLTTRRTRLRALQPQAAVRRRWHQESSPGRREPGAPWPRASVSPTRLSMMFYMESPRSRTDLSPSRHHLHSDSPLGQAHSSPSPSRQELSSLSSSRQARSSLSPSHRPLRMGGGIHLSSGQAPSSPSSSRRPLTRMGGEMHLRRPCQEYLEDANILRRPCQEYLEDLDILRRPCQEYLEDANILRRPCQGSTWSTWSFYFEQHKTTYFQRPETLYFQYTTTSNGAPRGN